MLLDDLIEQLQELQEEAEDSCCNYMEVLVHFQSNYPLKANIVNIKFMDDGTIAIALEDATEYGSKEAWE
ncbi:MAG: hypothetical protein IKY94_06495 [Lachnospiraceae bacterium]|nr:hypothetical protein [Clostridia bacterium]MBR4982189.1 hypothetical protein [Lachnospiraceae bacterium]